LCLQKLVPMAASKANDPLVLLVSTFWLRIV
jgi:hypothetical protein